MTPAVVWSLLRETFVEWYDDRAPRLGAALAYYTVFALAPGLILIIALAGLLLGKEAAQGQIISQVQDLAGEAGAEAVRAAIESARNAGSSLLATGLGVITLLFGLWGVFGELQDALNTIWGVASRPGRGVIAVIKQRFWSFTMVVGIGFLLLVSLAASAWLAAAGKFFSRLLPLPAAMMETTNALLSFVVITFMFAVIYKLLPDVKLGWRNVWTGAAVTAVLFTIGKTLIGLYLGRSTVASVYGAAGSLIVILLWVYYSAQVVFFGAEFTKVYSRRFDPAVVVPTAPHGVGSRTVLVATIVLGLLSASCARVQSHFALPELAAEERSFLPTIEAYTSAAHGGNTVTLLLNGDQIFPAQLEAIRAARQTISYAQYFYDEGPIGLEIAEALADRCRAGIRAHILLDGFGALLMPPAYWETMTQAGCKVATFRPLSPLSLLAAVGLRRDNKRNHRRILVIDGQIGFTGGSGVSPKWLGDGRTEGQWRDTDVRIEGPIVARLQGAFVENWLEATGNVLGGDAYFPPLPRRGTVSAQIVPSSPTGGSFSMYTMFLLAMSSARRSINITNPYFLPDARMMRVLTEAPGRGVRVVVLLPGAIDNNIVRQASRSTFGTLLRAGIEIYEYEAGLLHAKTMTIDGIWATIGSTNLDTRSFALNEELNAVMYSKDVATQLDQHFADDLRYSRKIDYREWRSRGFFPRLVELFSLPFREQL